MIIVEGPDGAGKTTLVHELSRRFGLRLGERGTTDRKKLYTVTRQDTYTALGEAVKGTTPIRIWDRLFYSELVYADIVGRPVEFNDVEQSYVRRMIEALHCPVILCLPDYKYVRENALVDKDQMDGVNENLVHIYNRYVELVVSTMPEHTLIYDYTTPKRVATDRGPFTFVTSSLAMICEDIDDYLQERRERTWA